jgi:gas vesicle protein
MSDNSKIFIGFMIGVGAGLVAGILLAPERGDETRKMIGEKAKAWSEGADVEKLTEATKEAFETVSEYVNKIRKGDKKLFS